MVNALLVLVSIGVVFFSFIALVDSEKLETIRVVATVVSAGAAVAIPIVVYQAAASGREAERKAGVDASTLQIMNELDQRVADVVRAKRKLDEMIVPLVDRATITDVTQFEAAEKKRKEQVHSFEHIETNKDVREQVIQLLNMHEFICVGANEGLLSRKIVLAMRQNALIATWKDYDDFIRKNRTNKAYKDSWTDCDKFIATIKTH